MASRAQARALMLREDPCFIMGDAGMPPDTWQSELLWVRPHRALVTTSRQSGKSTSCAALGLHRCNATPGVTVVAVSPTQRQSTLLVQKVRQFAEAVGIRLVRNASTFLKLGNESMFYGLPGHADTVRGYSPDLLIIDEAAYTAVELYNACTPMLAATQGDLVCISTPNGQQGWFWTEWSGRGADGWWRIEVPYTQISRITDDFIAGQKASMSKERFAAEYECAFNSATFGLFNASDLADALRDAPVTDGGAMPDPWDIINRNRQRQRGQVAAT